MLNNFIYAKNKSLFTDTLNNGEVLDEAIVFIEDTKEIWTHGTYFDCSTTDFAEILKDYVKTSSLSSYAKLSDLNWYITQTTADDKYVDKSSNQTITGLKTFTNHIVLNNQSRIRSNIDPGELKVTRTNDDKGFIIRVNKDSADSILPLEILTTNGTASYQYNFPKKSGTVALGVKKCGQVINANLTDGLIDLGDGYIKTTYANLKNLRNNSQLIPGQKYRITDYKTTVPALSGISVANHQFDVIVDALTPNTLSETAHVTNSVHSIGEKIQDLFSWDMNPGNWQQAVLPEIQGLTNLSLYVLLGTRTINQAGLVKVRFTAVPEDPETNDICIGADLVKNGTVVSKDYHIGRINYHPWQEENNIYYLPVTETGEYVIRYYVVGAASGFETNLKVTVEVYDGIDYFANSNLNSWEIKYCLDSDTTRFQWANIDPEINKGVIYYMKDDKGNECPYDFKNILFDNFYTFSYTVDGVLYDGTVKYQCYNNRILPTHNQDGVIKLNKNVFKNTSATSLCCFNTFGSDCEGNTFGDSCASNTFGNYCKGNSFGNNCLYNSFADYCQNNRFYHYCQSNSFGTYCTNNSFGSYILRITFGKQCINCKFSNSSTGNDQLLEACRMIKFGDLCNGVNLYNTEAPSYSSGKWLLNIEIDNGMSDNIQVQGLNKAYIRTIGKDSNNVVVEKCLKDTQDLINKVNYESDLNNNAEIGSLAMVINPDQLSIKDCYYTEETPKNINPVNIPYVINKDISNLYNLQLMLCPAGFSSLSDFDLVSEDVRSQMAVIIVSEEEGVPVVVYVFMYDPEAPSYLCSGLVDEATHNQNIKKLNDFISNRNLILYAVDHTVENPDLVSLTEELIESLDYLLHQINTTGLYFKDHTGWNNISETPKHELSEIKYEPTDFVKTLKDNFGVELELYPDGTPILNASRMVDLLAYLAAAAYVDANSVSTRLSTNYYNKDAIDTKLGDINSILESIIGKTMITFTIDETEYQAEEGMVWGTWLSSDLIHPDLDGVTGGTYQDKTGRNLLNADGALVRNLDLIIEGHEYRLV